MKLQQVVRIQIRDVDEVCFVRPTIGDFAAAPSPPPPLTKKVPYLMFPPIQECMVQFANLYTNIELKLFFDQGIDDGEWKQAPYDKFAFPDADDSIPFPPNPNNKHEDEDVFDPYVAPLFDDEPSTSDEEANVDGVMSNLLPDSPIQNLLGDE